MNTDTNDSNKSTEAQSTNLAETVGVVRSALETIEDDETNADCQASIDETGYYVLEDPDADGAWIRTQDIEGVRC